MDFLSRLWAGHGPRWIAPLLIVTAITVIYGQVPGHGFVNFDDPVYITDNPHVLRGLTGEGVKWAFTTGLTGMWQPLTWLSLMANVEWFGPGPAGFHAVNITLHAGSALLLYALLLTITGATGRSLLAALLFVVHPLNVESVAWASQRKSTLSALFCLLALQAWARYVRSGSRRAYGLTLLAYVAGLLAKPMLVTLPLMLLLLEVWPLAGRPVGWRTRMREMLPFFVLSAVFGWICLHPFGPTDVAPGGSRLVAADIMNTPGNLVTYLGRLVWPVDLTVLYPRRETWSGLLCGLSIAGLLAGSWLIWKGRRRVWIMGWGWFLLTILPVSGIIAIGPHATADRYVYLPAIGLFAAVAWTLPWRGAWLAMGGTVLVIYGAFAFAQVGLWRDSATLWRHAAILEPENPTELVNLGAGLIGAGREVEAAVVLHRALELAPAEQRAWLNLAYLHDRRGDKPAALADLQEAVRRVPGDARIHNFLGSVLQDLGRLPEAEAELREAIRLRPEFAEPWVNLGVLFAVRGELPEAVRAFERALQIQPYVAGARQNLALAQSQLAARGK